MARFAHKIESDHGESIHIDMTPMIDCIMFLLLFFLITSVFVDETGVQVNKPDIGGASRLDKDSLLFAVTADNKVVYGGKTVGVQGVGPIVKQQVLANPEISIVIQGDQNAMHGLVQRVHGEAKVAGGKKISVSARN